MSLDWSREQFGRAVVTMAAGEGDLRARTAAAVGDYLAPLDAGNVPRNLRPSFARLMTLLAPARERGDDIWCLESLSDRDVRRVARLIVELHGYLNTPWWSRRPTV
jgi:hypothetical protein